VREITICHGRETKDDARTVHFAHTTLAPFISRTHQHIDGYNLDAVLRGGFFKIKAPVFSHPYVVVQTIVVIIITLCVTAGFYTMHESGFMHVDPSIAAKADGIFGYFSGLSGFLFGFFVFNGLGGCKCMVPFSPSYIVPTIYFAHQHCSYIVSTIFFAHQHCLYSLPLKDLTVKNNYLGGFWGAAQNLFCLVAVFFPETDKKNKLLKLTLLRWTCASFHIMCGSVNELTTMPEVLQKAKDKNLLTDHEAEQTEGNAVIPLLWMMQVVGDQIYARKLPGAELKDSAAGGLILKMRSGIGGVACACSSFGLTPLPLVHLMSALVKMVRSV
jgi:hypothetical protein